jgi:hypothetical protein
LALFHQYETASSASAHRGEGQPGGFFDRQDDGAF